MNPRDALNQIRRWIGDREAKSYTRNGCRVSLANLPRERVVLDVDRAFPTDRAVKAQCDFILFYLDTDQGCLVIVPMELKRGDVDAFGCHQAIARRSTPRQPPGAKECQSELYPTSCLWQQENT